MISYEIFSRVQERLENGARGAARKDFTEDFILRGFVNCNDCCKPMTAAWTKGKTKYYPYYLCNTPGCPSKRKSIPRAKIDEGFEAILKSLQPTPGLFAVAKAMLTDVWDARVEEAKRARVAAQLQLKELEKQIEGLLDRLVDATATPVVKAYEKRIEKLERDKLLLTDRAAKDLPPKGRLQEFIELSLSPRKPLGNMEKRFCDHAPNRPAGGISGAIVLLP